MRGGGMGMSMAGGGAMAQQQHEARIAQNLYGRDTSSLQRVGNALSTANRMNTSLLDAVASLVGAKAESLEIKLYKALLSLGRLRTWVANGGKIPTATDSSDEEDDDAPMSKWDDDAKFNTPHLLIRDLRWSKNRKKAQQEDAERKRQQRKEEQEERDTARRQVLMKQIYAFAMIFVMLLVKIVQSRKANKAARAQQAWQEITRWRPGVGFGGTARL